MHDGWPHLLETWHEFYLLIGTAGLTLSGLLFVVVSFGARTVAEQAATGVRAFVSPNAVYFTVVMVVAAVLLVPAVPRIAVGLFLCLGAFGSLSYLTYTRVHRRWRENKLGALDWIWFVGMPVLSFAVLLLSGIGVLLQADASMYGVAVSVILLLVTGMRNAWDLVLWMAQREHGRTEAAREAGDSDPGRS
jgi:hypothetical protein